MAIQVTHVIFEKTLGGKKAMIPLAESWAFFENAQKRNESWDLRLATLTDGETTWNCFAKAWMAWFPDKKIWKLMRIGLGASGDGGPKNPGV